MIGAPPRHVRALPPHAIGAEGVGPYKLGVPMAHVLSTLPSGPRMALLQIPGVLDYSIVRDEGLLVGGERQGAASFIAVVRQEIARTEDGVGVRATTATLVSKVGPALATLTVARDPNLWLGVKLPGAHFVMAAGRVIGVLLTAVAPGAAPVLAASDADAGVGGPRCDRAATTAADFSGAALGVEFVPACLGGADGVGITGELVVVAARTVGDARARRVAAAEVRGLRWAAPIEFDRGRDEIIAVAETRDDQVRVFSVIALRLDGTRLVRVADAEVYRLDEQRAAWIGASLDDLAMYLEVQVDGDVLMAGGVLVHGGRGGVRELAPLLPVTIRRRGRTTDADRTRIEAPDAGPVDARPTDAGHAGAVAPGVP